MAQNTITYNDKSDNVPPVDPDKQVTADNLNEIKNVVSGNAQDVEDRFREVVIANLVAGVDHPQPNLHTASGAIPKYVQVKKSDGEVIQDAYFQVNQSTGVTTIQTGFNYSNVIFVSIGW